MVICFRKGVTQNCICQSGSTASRKSNRLSTPNDVQIYVEAVSPCIGNSNSGGLGPNLSVKRKRTPKLQERSVKLESPNKRGKSIKFQNLPEFNNEEMNNLNDIIVSQSLNDFLL